MNRKHILIIQLVNFCLSGHGAAAQIMPKIPTELEKTCALWRAYHLNGDSMVRWGSIDLTNEVPCANIITTVPVKPEDAPKDEMGPHRTNRNARGSH